MSTDLHVRVGAFITAKQRKDRVRPPDVAVDVLEEHLVSIPSHNQDAVLFISNHIDMLKPDNEAGYHVCDTVYIYGEIILFIAEHKDDIYYLRTQYDDVRIVFGVVSYWA
jgi:hypothetical protein